MVLHPLIVWLLATPFVAAADLSMHAVKGDVVGLFAGGLLLLVAVGLGSLKVVDAISPTSNAAAQASTVTARDDFKPATLSQITRAAKSPPTTAAPAPPPVPLQPAAALPAVMTAAPQLSDLIIIEEDKMAVAAPATNEAQRQLEAERRLLEAFGYDDTVNNEQEEGLSADEIAAFQASLGHHRRTPSGNTLTTPVTRYKDRTDQAPLCEIVSRWQAKDSPTGVIQPTVADKDSPLARTSRRASSHSKRQKQQQPQQLRSSPATGHKKR